MSQGNGSSKRFVPSGVDAQSWIGFEHRIQERRFKALVETINTAVAARDAAGARAALEEARELRPGAPELGALAARVALLPTGAVSAGSSYPWYRGLSAVAMFVVGIGLMIGIEGFRSTDPAAAPVKPLASASDHAIATPPAEPAPSVAEPAAAIEITAASASVDASPGVAAGAPERTPESRREAPVTAAAPHVPDAGVTAVPDRAPSRAPLVDADAAVLPASREVPDDYVAPNPRSEGRTGFAEITSPGPVIAANVIPQPISITAPVPTAPPAPLPAAPAAVAAPTVTPRSDDSRVARVLNEYARAYGQLDPGAARAVWPTVDERALARAFASLESQDVSFDTCNIDVKGTVANASCRGTASYVGKIGSRQARTEARQWNFELKLHGDDWKIEKAQTLAR